MTTPPTDCDPDWDNWPDRIHPDPRGQHAHEQATITDIHLESDQYL